MKSMLLASHCLRKEEIVDRDSNLAVKCAQHPQILRCQLVPDLCRLFLSYDVMSEDLPISCRYLYFRKISLHQVIHNAYSTYLHVK